MFAVAAGGVSTKAWKITSMEDFLAGEIKNVVVGSDGALTVGTELARTDLKSQIAYTAIKLKNGDILVGTGNEGKVFRVGKKGDVSEALDTEGMIVTGLVIHPDGDVIVTTIPGGKVIALGQSRGAKSKVLATFDKDEYIWSTALGKKGEIYVGTGPNGKIYKINKKSGKTQEIFKAPASHILSLAVGPGGELYAGTSEKGLLYRIEPNGKARILNDFKEEEVVSIALRGKSEVIVALNSAKTRPEMRGPPPPPAPPPGPMVGPPAPPPGKGGLMVMEKLTGGPPPGGKPPRDLGPVASAVYKVDKDGVVRNFFRLPNMFIGDMKVAGDGSIYIATGDDGRVFKIIDNDTAVLAILDLDETQATHMVLKGNELDIVTSSNPAAVYSGGTKVAAQGSFTSKVFDANFFSKWGRVHSWGSGSFYVELRTGNTDNPDEGWSNWAKVNSRDMPKVPVGRYAQIKVTLRKNARVEEIISPYRVFNQPPLIKNISVNGDKHKFQGPPKGGKKPPFSPTRFMEDMNSDRPPAHSSSKNITWAAESPDGDSTIYRLYYRMDGEKLFKPLTPEDGIPQTSFRWDTSSMPDGYYTVKLVANDEKSNPPGKELSDFGISDPFLVDNTRPEIKGLKVSRDMTVTGTAMDTTSAIVFLAYSVDNGSWVLIYSKDEIFDSKKEDFSFKLEGLEKGPHSVSVLALDMEYNPVSATAEFEVR